MHVGEHADGHAGLHILPHAYPHITLWCQVVMGGGSCGWQVVDVSAQVGGQA